MGAIWYEPQQLANQLSNTAGYKGGLALSVSDLCDVMSGTDVPDLIQKSEDQVVRLRAEEFEEVYHELLFRIGYLEERFNGDYLGLSRRSKYRKAGREAEYDRMLEILFEQTTTASAGSGPIDLTPFVLACLEEMGQSGYELAMEQVDAFEKSSDLNPHFSREIGWSSPIALRGLFIGTSGAPLAGGFIDQRFINFLARNDDRLPEIHWRKLEELTAEFFSREGFRVDLGPGSNDDGVDVRIWHPEAAASAKPLCLVQCKRQKHKVEKVVVKGLFADITHEGAEYGVLVTTSELSPGARTTVSVRGYPIREVNRAAVSGWLTKLRVPGSGIVRS